MYENLLTMTISHSMYFLLRFTVILSRKYRKLLSIPCSHIHPLTLPIFPEEWYICENQRSYIDRPSSSKVQGLTLDVICGLSLDKWILTCVHQCHIIQNSLTVLSILCALSIHSSFPSQPWQTLIFLLTPEFCLFQNVVYLESFPNDIRGYSQEPFQINFFHTIIFI